MIGGMVLGAGRIMAVSDREIGGNDFINQARFERDLRLPPIKTSNGDKPYIGGIAIHPTGAVDLVSFSELDTDSMEYRPRWFAAPRPYRALGALTEPAKGYRVSDFLGENSPPVGYSNAWWETPTGAMSLWMGGGAVLVGGVWPFILNFLVGAGLGRKPKEEEYDLGRFKSEPVSETKKELSEEERRRLEELEEELAARLGGAGDQPRTEIIQAPAPAKELASEVGVQVPLGPEEQKDYEGEYYPVEKVKGNPKSE